MKHLARLAFLPLLLAGACASTTSSDYSPARAGMDIASHLDEGQEELARERFDDYAEDEAARQRLFSVLYGIGEQRYDSGRTVEAVNIFRFLRREYPAASTVRDSLLFALFFHRLEQEQPPVGVVQEMGQLLSEMRRADEMSTMAHLVAAQYWVDRERSGEAAQSLERFQADWDGRPRNLAGYVAELERWILSHPEV